MVEGERRTSGDSAKGADRQRQALVADMAAVIERTTADLALAEEPARFIAALEGEPPTPPESARDRD